MINSRNESPVRLGGSLSDLPVFKIDMHGHILQNNEFAQTLLSEWGCQVNDRLPDSILGTYPDILKAWTCSEVEIEFSGCKVGFTIVPFLEAGYIGLYAHKVADALTIPLKRSSMRKNSI